MALEFWDIAADRLRKSLGNNNYKSWIEPLQLVGESAGTAEFFVPTSFLEITYASISKIKFSIKCANLGLK